MSVALQVVTKRNLQEFNALTTRVHRYTAIDDFDVHEDYLRKAPPDLRR